MTTFNTGNPVPSADARDRFDNSQTFDEVINGTLTYYPNRVGQNVLSLKGMQSLFNAEQADRASAFSVEQDRRDDAFQQFIESSGWSSLGPYAAGVTITSHSQTVDYMGQPYQLKPSISVSLDDPYVTTGDWATESVNFKLVGDNSLRQDLALPDGLSKTGFIQDAVGAMPRDGLDKMRERASVKDFGPAGTGNGVTSDHLAALAMGAALGFVHFSRGNYVLDTCTIDYPISFDKKANVTVNSGQTVTIRAAISSPKQFILKGAGTYSLTQIDAAGGEDVRYVHASWFGAFPSVANVGDQGPAINRGFASMGNSRESVMEFDIGGYVMSSQVSITRGGWVKGAGSRRTVFKFNADGYIGFIDTVSGLAKITDCNFELIPGTVTNRVSPFVQFNGNESEFYNVRLGETVKGLVVTGNSARIYNIAAAYGSDKGAGSDVIHIKGGNGHFVHDINLATSSAFGPEAIVRVGGAGAGGINYVNIRNIYHMTPSVSVIAEAVDDNIVGLIVNGLQYNGFAGTPPAQMVRLSTSGAASMADVSVDKVQGSSRSIAMVTLLQGSSTFMHRIDIDGVQDKRTDGNGIELIRTAGVLEEISIGSGVQLKTRDNVIFRSGTIGGVRVAEGVEKDSSPNLARKVNILDDAVYTLALGHSVFSAIVQLAAVASSAVNFGHYAVRAASSPSNAVIAQSAGMAVVNTALTGTTGVDGKITLGVTNGVLYVENRSGAAVNLAIGVTGV